MKVFVVLKHDVDGETVTYAVTTSEAYAQELEAQIDKERWSYGTYDEHEVV